MDTRTGHKTDMGKLVLECMGAILITLIILFIAQKWALADPARQPDRILAGAGDVLHKTNKLADAFKYCGVEYKELDEQVSTQNYIHCINIAKKKAIVMYKCDVSENVHYFVASGGKCYFIDRMFRGQIKEKTRIWVVYAVPLGNEFSPLTGIYREMMLEFIRDTGQCPRTKKPKGTPI